MPAAGYLAAGLLYGDYLLRQGARVLKYAEGVAAAALLVHLGVLVRGLAGQPPAIPHGVVASLSPVALLIVLAFLALQRFSQAQVLGVVVMPLAFAATLTCALLSPPSVGAVPEALRSPWFLAHVPSSLAAYVAFVVAAGAAVLYLAQGRLLKSKHLLSYLESVPSQSSLDRLVCAAVKLGFVLLTIGIATGAVWAQHTWGRYWAWTPKQCGSLATWLIFAAFLHARVVRGWQGPRSAWLVLLGLGAVLLTYLGAGSIPQDPHYFP